MREELLNLPQGWFHHGEKILSLLEAHRPMVCVELGTWKGASAIAMARVLRKWGGHLTCIDTWTGAVDQVWGTKSGYPGMLVECANNIITAGVEANVCLMPAKTDEAAAHWSGWIDFLYVDADHSYQSVVTDLAMWWPFVKKGGLIAGDDYGNPQYPGVAEAWDEFEERILPPFERYDTPNTDPAGMQLIWGVKT